MCVPCALAALGAGCNQGCGGPPTMADVSEVESLDSQMRTTPTRARTHTHTHAGKYAAQQALSFFSSLVFASLPSAGAPVLLVSVLKENCSKFVFGEKLQSEVTICFDIINNSPNIALRRCDESRTQRCRRGVRLRASRFHRAMSIEESSSPSSGASFRA